MSEEFSIKKALEDVVAVYVDLMAQTEELDRQYAVVDQRMAKLLLKIVSLANLSDDVPEDSLVGQMVKNAAKLGLTDAVRMVLKASGERMAATQVRDQLIRIGVNLSRFKNPIASITTVLLRINSQGEANLYYDEPTDKWTFQWVGKKSDDIFRKVPSELSGSIGSRIADKMVNEPTKKMPTSKKKKGKKGKK